MNVNRTLGWGILMLTSAWPGAGQPASAREAPAAAAQRMPSAPDEAAVRRLIADFADSWNRHDMAAMHALDTPDVEWVNVVGNDWIGVENVRKGHANFHRVLAADNVMHVDEVAVHLVAPDVAIAVTKLHFNGKSIDGRPPEAFTRGSWVMVKRARVWKIAYFQNTAIDPTVQGPMDPLQFDEKTGLPVGAK